MIIISNKKEGGKVEKESEWEEGEKKDEYKENDKVEEVEGQVIRKR